MNQRATHMQANESGDTLEHRRSPSWRHAGQGRQALPAQAQPSQTYGAGYNGAAAPLQAPPAHPHPRRTHTLRSARQPNLCYQKLMLGLALWSAGAANVWFSGHLDISFLLFGAAVLASLPAVKHAKRA